MKILITGGAGFIGSHLLQRLHGKPGLQLTVVDNLDTGYREYVPEDVEFIQADIRSQELEACFASHHFDAVLHLAAQTMVPFSMEHPREDCDVNLLGLINVLECCRKYQVPSLTFSSSAAVYGDNENVPLKETEMLKPTSFYGITKMATEHYLRVYHEVYGLNTTVFRFANVYGERQGAGGEGGVVSVFCKLLAAGEPVTIYGDGEQTRGFVYAGDIARALEASLSLQGFHVLNVSTTQETSINQLVAYFEQAAGTKLVVHYAAKRDGDIYRSFLDNRELISVLKLQPEMDLARGILQTYNWYKHEKGGQ